MESIGYTFQPQDAELIRRKMNGAAGSIGPMASRALQILSMRLPSVMGGRPLASSQLMTPPVGGAGAPGPAGPVTPGGGLPGLIGGVLGGGDTLPLPGNVPPFTPYGPGNGNRPSFTPGQGPDMGQPGSPLSPSGPTTGGGAGYDAPMDPGHFFPGNWPF
jgi:hypothetical protein